MSGPFYARLRAGGYHLAEENQKIHCRDCGGTELYNTVLSARNGVIIGRKTRTGDEWMLVRCLICLTCGSIMPFLPPKDLERLRSWAYEGAVPTDYPDAQTPETAASGEALAGGGNPAEQDTGRGFGTIIILCLILGALLGVLGAIYGVTHE